MTPSPSPLADTLGTPGAPGSTLEALKRHFQDSEPSGLSGDRLILLTDTQGHRSRARYAALLTQEGGTGEARTAVITAPAFGPHYGPQGAAALRELAHWGQERELPVRETVLNRPDFNRVVEEPDAEEVERLVAASNPSDYGIYTTLKDLEAGL